MIDSPGYEVAYTLFHVCWTTFYFNRSHLKIVSPYDTCLLPAALLMCTFNPIWTGAFPQLLKTRGVSIMAHRHSSYISSQMKLKLGIGIIWVMLPQIREKADDVIVSLFI